VNGWVAVYQKKALLIACGGSQRYSIYRRQLKGKWAGQALDNLALHEGIDYGIGISSQRGLFKQFIKHFRICSYEEGGCVGR
jgi:hypothetical protein